MRLNYKLKTGLSLTMVLAFLVSLILPIFPVSGSVSAQEAPEEEPKIETIADLEIGSRVVDYSWEWEFKTGDNYSGAGVSKPVTWIVVAKDHYNMAGEAPHVTLLSEDLIGKHKFNSTTYQGSPYGINYWGDMGYQYESDAAWSFLNHTFYNEMSKVFQSIILDTNLPNKYGATGSPYTSTDKVFLPSQTELGGKNAQSFTIGSEWKYFDGKVSSARVGKLGGNAMAYWTRSPLADDESMLRVVKSDGSFYNAHAVSSTHEALRPVINVVASTTVSEVPNANGIYTITKAAGNAVLSPSKATFVKNFSDDIVIGVTENYRTFMSLSVNGKELERNVAYDFYDNVCTIYADYLEGKNSGELSVRFMMDGGTNPVAVIDIVDNRTLGDLKPGDKVIDNSWSWEHKTGDNYSGSGVKKPITWIVAAKDHYENIDSHVTLITEELIGKYAFNDVSGETSPLSEGFSSNNWGDSSNRESFRSVRNFLNTDFYNALSDDFRSLIIETSLPNKDWELGSAYTTDDNVFLPSVTELMGSSYDDYPIGSKLNNLISSNYLNASLAGVNRPYWTRSPSADDPDALLTHQPGGMLTYEFADSGDVGIRPALNLTADTPVSVVKNSRGIYEISGTEIMGFAFNGEKNDALFKTVTGKIEGNNIQLLVPHGTDLSALKASFIASPGVTVKVGNITQVSSVTPNNFTNPVIYDVTSSYGETKQWKVIVRGADSTMPLDFLNVGDRLVDRSWEWNFRTGENHSGAGGSKPVTWIVVAKDHYDGMDSHITLISEEIIGKYVFDDSTERNDIAEPDPGWNQGSSHWGDSGSPDAENGLRPFLNETFYNAMSPGFKNAVLSTKVPNATKFDAEGKWVSESNGSNYTTNDKVFIPSATELGRNDSDSPVIGSSWGYFTNNNRRMAYLAGSSLNYWTRSPALVNGADLRYVSNIGIISFSASAKANNKNTGVRPALNLSSKTSVYVNTNSEGIYEIPYDTTPIDNLQIGDRVIDNTWNWEHRTGDRYSGSGENKPVTWVVVAKDHYDGMDSHVTLISEEIIGKQAFNVNDDYRWRYSTVREWLNPDYDNGFFEAMTFRFQDMVLETPLPNKDIFDESYMTYDKVFLPSTTEMGDTLNSNTYKIGEDWGFFKDNNSRIAKLDNTEHIYLTRSPDSQKYDYVHSIGSQGNLNVLSKVSNAKDGVRPATNVSAGLLVSLSKNDNGVYEVEGKGRGADSVNLSMESFEIYPGAHRQLFATINPENASNKNVVWSTENEDIAVVDESGIVTGVSSGITSVTVTTVSGGYTARCTVVVLDESNIYSLGNLAIGDRVIDYSWEWEHKTGDNYTGSGETKPVGWIVADKDSGNGVTLIAEELIGRYCFDNSTDRGSSRGNNHYGDSGKPNATMGIRSFLNDTFYDAMSYNFLNAINDNNLWIRDFKGKEYDINDKIFLPSQTNLGGGSTGTYSIGYTWSYFASGADKVATLGGNMLSYRTISPATNRGYNVRTFDPVNGFINTAADRGEIGVRPAVSLSPLVVVTVKPNADGYFEIKKCAAVDPVANSYQLGTNESLVFELTPNERTFRDLTDGSGLLIIGEDYTIDGNEYSLLPEYLETQRVGIINLTFIMDAGVNPEVEINIGVVNTIPVSMLKVGDRLVDNSWYWQHKNGGYYTGKGEIKPVTWVVVAKNHYNDMDPHVTLMSEELIGKHVFDNSNNRGSGSGSNHWGKSGWSNADSGIRKFLNGSSYSGNDINSYNTTFYDAIGSDFQSYILTTKVPNKEWEKGVSYNTMDKIFIPSQTELGGTIEDIYKIGDIWSFYADNYNPDSKLGGIGWHYRTRSPASNAYSIRTYYHGEGFKNLNARDGEAGIRPVLNLSFDALVSNKENPNGVYEFLGQATVLSEIEYLLGSGDLNVTLTLNGRTVKRVLDEDGELTEGVDYTTDGVNFSFKVAYLEGKGLGASVPLVFEMKVGEDAATLVNIRVGNAALTTETTHYLRGSGANVGINLSPNGRNFVKISDGSNDLVAGNDYTVNNNTYTIGGSYFSRAGVISKEKITLTFVMDGGENPEIEIELTDIFPVATDHNMGSTANIVISLYLDGRTVEKVNNGTVGLVNGTDYMVAGNTCTIYASYLNGMGVGETTLDFVFSDGSTHKVTIDINPGNAALVTETTHYLRGSGANAGINLIPNGRNFVKISDGSNDLVAGSDYTVNNNTYTIRGSYFSGADMISKEKITLTFVMDGGENPEIEIEMSDIFPVAIDHIMGSTANIVISLYLDGRTLAKVNDGTEDLVNQTDYMVEGNTCTIYASYLNGIGVGQATLDFVLSDGSTYKVTIDINLGNAALVTETTHYLRGSGANVGINLIPNGRNFVKINDGSSDLEAGSDYVVNNNTYTIRGSYFSGADMISKEKITLTFVMDGGENPEIEIELTDIFPVAIDHIMGSTANIVISLYLDGRTLEKVNDGTEDLVNETDYRVEGNTCTIYASYLNGIGVGETTLDFVLSDGSTYKVTINIIEESVKPGETAKPVLLTQNSIVGTDTIMITGTAEPESLISIIGGAEKAEGVADNDGNFVVEVLLNKDTLNMLAVTAKSAEKAQSQAVILEITHVKFGYVLANDTITVSDAIVVLRHIVGLIDLESSDYPEGALRRAKVNDGDTLSVTDAIMILRYVVGLIDDFGK